MKKKLFFLLILIGLIGAVSGLSPERKYFMNSTSSPEVNLGSLGNSADGVWNGDVSSTSGLVTFEGDNKALSFDGSGDYLDTGATNLSGDATVFAVFKATDLSKYQNGNTGCSDEGVIASGGYDGSTTAWELKFSCNDNVGDASHDFQVSVYDGTSTKAAVVDSDYFSSGTTYKVLAGYNGSKLDIHINGSRNVDGYINSGSTGFIDNSADTWIGGLDNQGSLNDDFYGTIDEVRTWNTWLNSTQRSEVFTNGKVSTDSGGGGSNSSNSVPYVDSRSPFFGETGLNVSNGDGDVDVNLSAKVFDADGDNISGTFYVNGSIVGTFTEVSNGSTVSTLAENLNKEEVYTWNITVNDGNDSTTSVEWDFGTASGENFGDGTSDIYYTHKIVLHNSGLDQTIIRDLMLDNRIPGNFQLSSRNDQASYNSNLRGAEYHPDEYGSFIETYYNEYEIRPSILPECMDSSNHNCFTDTGVSKDSSGYGYSASDSTQMANWMVEYLSNKSNIPVSEIGYGYFGKYDTQKFDGLNDADGGDYMTAKYFMQDSTDGMTHQGITWQPQYISENSWKIPRQSADTGSVPIWFENCMRDMVNSIRYKDAGYSSCPGFTSRNSLGSDYPINQYDQWIKNSRYNDNIFVQNQMASENADPSASDYSANWKSIANDTMRHMADMALKYDNVHVVPLQKQEQIYRNNYDYTKPEVLYFEDPVDSGELPVDGNDGTTKSELKDPVISYSDHRFRMHFFKESGSKPSRFKNYRDMNSSDPANVNSAYPDEKLPSVTVDSKSKSVVLGLGGSKKFYANISVTSGSSYENYGLALWDFLPTTVDDDSSYSVESGSVNKFLPVRQSTVMDVNLSGSSQSFEVSGGLENVGTTVVENSSSAFKMDVTYTGNNISSFNLSDVNKVVDQGQSIESVTWTPDGETDNQLSSSSYSYDSTSGLLEIDTELKVNPASNSNTLTVSYQAENITDKYDKYKPAEVSSASGNPVVYRSQYVGLTCGTDTTTGFGDLVLDCGSIDGKEDVYFTDQNGDRLDWEFESFSLDTGGSADVWVYNEGGWLRDDTAGMRVYYGSGASDYSTVEGAWNNTRQGTVLAAHLGNNPLTAFDSSPNSNSGTVNGASYTTSGQFDGGADFSGSDQISYSDSNSLDVADSLTVQWWAKPAVDQPGSTVNPHVLRKGQAGSSNSYFQIIEGSTGHAWLRLTDSGDTDHGLKGTSNLTDGNWHYTVGSYNASSGTQSLFVDDEEEASANIGSISLNQVNDGLNLMNSGADSDYVKGTLDEVRIYSKDKDLAWKRAGYNASVKGGQTFFRQLQPVEVSSTDTTSPSITIHSPLNQTYSSGSVDLNVSTDEPANFTWNVDGGTNQSSNENDNDLNTELSGLSSGGHTVSVYANDSAGNVGGESVSFTVDTDPVASFSANITSLDIGETVEFDASGSTDNGTITSYDWTFGDGNTGTGQVVTHSYSSTGTYTVDLTVTDDQGNTDSTSQTVEVVNKSAAKSGAIESCPNGTPFCTSDTNPVNEGSVKPGETISVSWKINATGNAGNTFETFTVLESDNPNVDSVNSSIINVSIVSDTSTSNSPPSADFTVSATDLTVDVDASGSSDSDGTITNYEWDWTDDGTYESTGQTSSHTYSSNGTYTIKLRVTDDQGATSTLSKTVSVSSSTSDGGDSGGDTGGGDTVDNETTVTVDGSTATLLAPHSGARYSKSTFTVEDGATETVTINGEETTFEVNNILDTNEAEIILNGVQRNWQEEESETVNGVQISLVDVAVKGDGGTVSFTLNNVVKLNEPVHWFAYNYTINNSGSVELQVREAGPGNTWNTTDTQTVSSTTENQYVNFTQNLEAGIYEARLRLNASGNTSISNVNGFYSGEVPAIDITVPKEKEQIEAPRTPKKRINLSYRFDYRDNSNVSAVGQFFREDSTGNIYSEMSEPSIVTVSENENFLEQLANLFGFTFEEAYGKAFAWLLPQEPDTYIVDSEMDVKGGFGDYTGYVNATVNDSTGSEKVIYSYGRNIELVPQSVENYIENNSYNPVIDVGKAKINNSYPVDQDGDGVVENVTVDTLVTGLDTPEDNSTVVVETLENGTVDFHFFAMNINGTAIMNKSLVLEDNESTVYRERLVPGKSEYSIDVNGSQVSEWENKNYTYYIEYFEPGTSDVSLYNSTQDNINNTFVVEREKNLVTALERFYQGLRNAIDGFTKALAEEVGVTQEKMQHILGALIVAAISIGSLQKSEYIDLKVAIYIAIVLAAVLSYFQWMPQIVGLSIVLLTLLKAAGWLARQVTGG